MSIINPGLLTTGNIVQDARVRDVSPAVAFYGPRFNQLLLIGMHPAPATHPNAFGYPEDGAQRLSFKTRTATNFKYEWMESTLKSNTTQINKVGGYAAGDTSFVVDDASIFAVNDLVKLVATGETVMVNSVNTSTNTITVTRSWGTVAAGAVADNAYLLIIGNAYSEASSYQLNPVRKQTFMYNFVQDIRHSVSGSYVLDKSNLYYGDQRNWLRNEMLIEHLRYIEASMLFGERNDGVGVDGQPCKTMGGLIEFQGSNNVIAVGGTLTKATWNTWLRGVFANGSGERIVLCSALVANAISNFAADTSAAPASQIWLMNNASDFGLNIMSFRTKYGTVHLVIHGMFTGTVYGGYAMAIDPEKISIVKINGGFFLNLREDVVQDGAHRWVDEYATYASIEYRNPELGGLLTGITG